MQALDFNLWSNIVTLAWTDLYLLLLCNSSTQVFGWCLSCPIVWTIFYLIKAIVGKSVNIFLAYCCAYRLDYAPLRRMYGLHTVFLECGQLVRPPNWLSSLYGLTVKKKSIIFDILKQKYWRSLEENSKRSFMQYGFDNATLKPYNHNFGFCLFHFPSHYMAEMISHKKNSYKQQAEKKCLPLRGKLPFLW